MVDDIAIKFCDDSPLRARNSTTINHNIWHNKSFLPSRLFPSLLSYFCNQSPHSFSSLLNDIGVYHPPPLTFAPFLSPNRKSFPGDDLQEIGWKHRNRFMSLASINDQHNELAQIKLIPEQEHRCWWWCGWWLWYPLQLQGAFQSLLPGYDVIHCMLLMYFFFLLLLILLHRVCVVYKLTPLHLADITSRPFMLHCTQASVVWTLNFTMIRDWDGASVPVAELCSLIHHGPWTVAIKRTTSGRRTRSGE